MSVPDFQGKVIPNGVKVDLLAKIATGSLPQRQSFAQADLFDPRIGLGRRMTMGVN